MMNPLIQAVIANDIETVKNQCQHQAWCQETDPLGFTALELAHFLGREQCAQLLGDNTLPQIRLKAKGKAIPLLISTQKFAQVFAVTYRKYPFFASYDIFKQIINNCPYVLRSACIAQENYTLTNKYRNEIANGLLASIEIRWIDPFIQYGTFAVKDIPQGSYIGEYTGVVCPMTRSEGNDNGYCLHYPTRFWSWHYYVIDALKEGNEMRFVNHSDQPNMMPLCLVDRGLLRLILVAQQDIVQGEQLTFDYGPDYWRHRSKIQL
jgi:hypothetical protein